MNNPSQTKDMNLTQLLEDWIGADEAFDTGVNKTSHSNAKKKGRNQLRAEMKKNLPSLLAKIEQHILEARKDELQHVDPLVRYYEGTGDYSLAEHRIAELDALLNTKGGRP